MDMWFCQYQRGIIYIGKNDKGEVVGVANAKKLLVDIPNKTRDILGVIIDVNLHTTPQGDYLGLAEKHINASLSSSYTKQLLIKCKPALPDRQGF